MKNAHWWLVLALSACGPVVTAHPGPSFEVTSAPKSPGVLFFDMTRAQRFVGRLELSSSIETTHPLRLAVRWGKEAPVTLSPRFDTRLGAQSFDITVAPPPDTALQFVDGVTCTSGRFGSAKGDLIVFVDVNENGELDLFDTTPVDQVVGSSLFPRFELFGLPTGDDTLLSYSESCGPGSMSVGGQPANGVSGEVKSKLFLDERMDLVACNATDVFTAPSSCGIRTVQTPRVTFSASSAEQKGSLSFISAEPLRVFVDDELQGTISEGSLNVSSEALLEGTHRLRVEGEGYTRAWEATVALPQPVVILERPAKVEGGKSYNVSWSTQPGVLFYWFSYDLAYGRDAVMQTGGSASYLQAEPLSSTPRQNHIVVTANFLDFPGSASASFDVPLQ